MRCLKRCFHRDGLGGRHHAVCVINTAGEIIAEFTIAHSADGITGLIRRLARYGDPAAIPIAIERPNGRLADLLLEAVTLSLARISTQRIAPPAS